MRSVVSGSGGFIGSALKERLKERGFYAGAIDRDLNVPENPNIIYHLASYGNMFDQTDTRRIYDVNVGNTRKLLENFPSDLFVYFSSSSVYAPKDDLLLETDPILGTTDYELSKVMAEEICTEYAHDRDVYIIRPFSVTGMGEQKTHLIPVVIKAAFEGEEIPLDPDPVHDYIDIEDFVDALTLITDSKREKERNQLEIWNIGSGKQYSNLEVVCIITRLTGKQIITRVPFLPRSYDKTSWVADTTKLRKLGWKAKISLEESIKKQIEDYKKKPW